MYMIDTDVHVQKKIGGSSQLLSGWTNPYEWTLQLQKA